MNFLWKRSFVVNKCQTAQQGVKGRLEVSAELSNLTKHLGSAILYYWFSLKQYIFSIICKTIKIVRKSYWTKKSRSGCESGGKSLCPELKVLWFLIWAFENTCGSFLKSFVNIADNAVSSESGEPLYVHSFESEAILINLQLMSGDATNWAVRSSSFLVYGVHIYHYFIH